MKKEPKPELITPAEPVKTVRVVVPLFIAKALDYSWPLEAEPAQLFEWVEVPVGGKNYHGMVVALNPEMPLKGNGKAFKLKKARSLGLPALPKPTGLFYQWVSQYNFTHPGEGVRAALQGGRVPEFVPPEKVITFKNEFIAKTAAQEKVLACLKAPTAPPFNTQTALAAAAGVSIGVIKGLLEKGLLEWCEALNEEVALPTTKKVTLTPDQQNAAIKISAAVQAGAFTPFLLDGVTGSGKTEVYFEVIDAFFKAHEEGQILVLLPEIALTPQWLARFEMRFGFQPVVWHSGLGQKARKEAWWAAFKGCGRVVVGARSALFLPFRKLKLVVVDEEHDPSYKQEDNFRYHGRDMAIVRAKLFSCPVVLASATPSLESWHNMQQGRFEHLVLKSRYGAALPEIEVVDLKKDKPSKADRFISPPLLAALKKTVAEGKQALLFLNRRGYAPLLICRKCGHRLICPSCSAHMVVHGAYVQCHHCTFTEPLPDVCPQCHSEHTLHSFGPGTRKILKEVKDLLPGVRAIAVDRDNVQTPADMAEVVHQTQSHAIDVLVGTQMLAKGHDFTKLQLVGVLDADMSLAQGDLRALERTFQLLTQVAGRAGRRAEKGRVIVQTHTPEHPIFAAIKTFDRDLFLNTELRARQQSSFPPFGRLVSVIVSGPDEAQTLSFSQRLAQNWPVEAGAALLLGPAPAPLYKRQDQYRFRFLLKAEEAPHSLLKKWLKGQSLPKGIRLDVDIDPQSFM